LNNFIVWLRQCMWTMWAAPPAVEPPEEERGSELVQTALILALVVIVAIGVLQALGVNIVGKFQDVVSALGG
jgi:Flp pilus assembly pilin Flp